MDKPVLAIGALTALVLAGIIYSSAVSTKNFQPRNQCVEHSASLSMHIHQQVNIFIDGQLATIPDNIGVGSTCMKALHTHAGEPGKIHVEYPQTHDFLLEDFFANWGQSLSKNQIMDKTVDDQHTLTMTVDGQPNTDFEKLILRDGQTIEIRYETKK
jgi:hypothetical protein